MALRRPYTFVVMALLIFIGGIFTILRTPVDIFPEFNIPIISVIWTYNGISAEEMERRIVTINERAYTNTVNDIEHIESSSLKGVSNIKVFFQPGAKIEAATAQLTAITQAILRIMPPGTTPPFIVKYNATNVPILQIGLSSESLSEQEIGDLGNNYIRQGLAVVQGATITQPTGGKNRQVMVDILPEALYAKGLSPADVSTALGNQNLVLPAGVAKIGPREYDVRLNSSPDVLNELNNLPIKQSPNGPTVFMRDVAHVHDGFGVQTNIARQDGKRSAYLTVLKNGGASTLDIIKRIKEALPKVIKSVPEALKVNTLFDQSVFVQASISGVLHEGLIAAGLTALMILLFLGSWRSTLIVATSIPLSILSSIIVLSLFGQTLNIMTLGGLALAVGILVDDATVELENVHRNLAMGKGLIKGILDGAEQIAMPALVSTLAICIVFVPVFFLPGVAGSMFSPFAIAVIFAMLPSYLLSRTIIPTMVQYMLPAELELYTESHEEEPPVFSETKGGPMLSENPLANSHFSTETGQQATPILGSQSAPKHDLIWRFHLKFNEQFNKFRHGYLNLLYWVLHHKAITASIFVLIVAGIISLAPLVGQDFFPKVDAGQFRLHFRAPSGTRIEITENYCEQVEKIIRDVIPKKEMGLILANLGIGSTGVNLAFTDNPAIGTADGELIVQLKEGHGPTEAYTKEIRKRINSKFPEISMFYQASDIVTQILNFGLPAAINVQVTGRNTKENYPIAKELLAKIREVDGAADVRLNQVLDFPQIKMNVDRTRASQLGLTQRDVASDMLISLSGSFQTAPNYWVNPKNGISYPVLVQTPPVNNANLNAIGRTPVSESGTSSNRQAQLLQNLITTKRSITPGIVTHYNVEPTYDILANVEDRDLGSVANDIDQIVNEISPKLPRGSGIKIRGQVLSMRSSFNGIFIGLLASIVLIYLLMVINFQSWTDPFIIIMALPGAIAGIIAALLVTGTTFSVPSLMGAIMCIGVATANSILMVTFANDERRAGKSSFQAAMSAGFTRLRPVLMTALAMMVGMVPMALGYGEGSEQNAPLGRAVIGGLLFATLTTLLIVPMVYSLMRKNRLPFTENPELDEKHFKA